MTFSPELLAAVAVLDKDQPGWWRKVDLGTLSFFAFSPCVLRQVYSHLGPCALGIAINNVFGGLGSPHYQTIFRAYEPQWRSLISERQSADSIGSSLSIPDPREEAVEGYARVAV